MAATFGLDFGTTNSLISVVRLDAESNQFKPFSFTDEVGMPHPSVVWYPGGQPIVGRGAKSQLSELGLGVFGDVVRSPKMFLGSANGVYVGGVTRQAVDVVSEVLNYVRHDALNREYGDNTFVGAVVTIPVTMRGPARAELRLAAQKAGIRVHQFVHEPLAALYGYLRPLPEFRQQIASLDRRLVLVFDWGGGTLDLTLCELRDGILTQVLNLGDADVGGDRFDDRLRLLTLEKHQLNHPNADLMRVQPSAEARLLQACEDTKIALSSTDSYTPYVRDYLASPGPDKDLVVQVMRQEFENAVQDLVSEGLKKIESLPPSTGVTRGAIEFCLATGGMVSMPRIREGLLEIFGVSRLRLVDNAAHIISEGAAWIAHDGVSLQLAKPIELLHADDTYVEIVPSGTPLPQDGNQISSGGIDVYCVDPSDGAAKFLFARPRWPGHDAHGDDRETYTHLSLPVDRRSKPLFERLRVQITIDHDLIAKARAQSCMSDETRQAAIHDLEFGLSVREVLISE